MLRVLMNLLFAVLACIGIGCASASSEPWVELRGQRFSVEIADSQVEQARGLMFRDSMPADHGMLFVNQAPRPQAFWMKNTKIPLDIIYFDQQRELINFHPRVPPCSGGNSCPSYASEGDVMYTLELNGGTAEKIGLRQGDVITFSPTIVQTDSANSAIADSNDMK